MDTWSFKRCIMRVVHSPPGMTFGSVRKSRRRQRAALCLTTSNVSLKFKKIIKYHLSMFRYKFNSDKSNVIK